MSGTQEPQRARPPQPGTRGARIKTALELGPILAFLALYMWLREESFPVAGREYDGFIVVTGLFIPVLAVSNWLLYRLMGRISRIQIATLVLVVVMGGLTIWLNDERFFKMKSTFVFGGFAGLLWIGLARGQSWLAYVMEGLLPIAPEGWMVLTRRLAWFFLLMAVANEVIWRSFSTDVYVIWDTLGQAGALFAFFMAQSRLIERYWTGPKDS
jgi:intracellular septation protein